MLCKDGNEGTQYISLPTPTAGAITDNLNKVKQLCLSMNSQTWLGLTHVPPKLRADVSMAGTVKAKLSHG